MNEAEKANQESDVYLQQVRLKNYKSIIDAEIDFKPGLNIIIGNNGSGKTNFLNYLHDVVDADWDSKPSFLAEFTFKNKIDVLKIKVSKKIEINLIPNVEKVNQDKKQVDVKIFCNDKISHELNMSSIGFSFVIFESISYNTKKIQYGIPKEQAITEKSLNIIFNPGTDFLTIDSDFSVNQPYFIKSIFHYISYSAYRQKAFDIHSIKTIVKELDNIFIGIKSALISYTDIKDFRISPNYNVYALSQKNNFSIQNLYLEFFINNNWLPFTNLSDGNKRLFYIISEVLSYDQIDILNIVNEVDRIRNTLKIILLEEPELGIHPHQLHKLMLFIKEQSKTKQIILTTHSPQVLNILDADELDRVIICSYDQEKGTQLNHLTEEQIKKGQMYMQDEGFLSDYWVHSDLEPAS